MFDIPYPEGFQSLDSVQAEPWASGPECGYRWYFAVYGKVNKDAPALQYVFRWLQGDPVAESVILEEYTTARGSLGIGAGGAGLWLLGYDTGGKKRKIQRVEGWTPPLWMRTASEIASIRRELSELRAQPDGPALDAGDREALNKLRAMLGI